MINDEIKEILDYISDRVIEKEKWNKVRDYITILQQRIEYLERSNNRREDTIIGLRDEINDYEDYKSRCEKAVEIYDNTITYLTTINAEYMDSNTKKTIQDIINKLEKELDILNGRSDE